MYEVSRRTVTNIAAASEEIMKQASNSSSLNIKSRRASKFPSIEEKVYAFITVARAHKMPVTVGVIQQKLLIIRDDMLFGSSTAIQCETLQSFTPSKGWANICIKRRALRSVPLSGEADSANMQMVAADMAKLRQKLADYDANCIFNVDETGLFF